MKYLKLFENFNDIHRVCIEYDIENYTIGSDGSVDVDGHVFFENRRLEKIPIKFGKVTGEFDCNGNILTSLEGGPKEVGGGFNCSVNLLSSLKGCPDKVGSDFDCSNNHLSSLEGGPKEVGGNFSCDYNNLTSLKGCPKEVDGNFWCSFNNLTSLEGCPDNVGGDFNCFNNQLTSLEGCPKKVGGVFHCSNNQLTIIDYLPEWIEGDIDLDNNQIRDIKVENKNYLFLGKCYLDGNPIYDLFKYWEGDLKNFILELEFEDFIRDEGKSVDMLRFEYALNGKEYKGDITNYNLIWK